ncbi:MAG: PorP/SprF family type IX secretion system membrane protein [Mucilaginibacter polytrichastri]|nr:PorP/SprF family type IX secretion system membrane protein [Mucilaginibacter polytrichastri]
MKKLIITLGLAAAAFLLPGRSQAQIDPHFSQYYAYPLWLNPALTGVINGDLRINANYRNQWGSISNAYSTAAVSADYRPNERIGLGLTILNQSAGDVGFNYFNALGSFSYGILVSQDGYHHVNFGVQAGLINRSFDMNKAQFGSQYDPEMGYNGSMPSYENFMMTNTTVFDANAGIFYYDGNPMKTANVFGGLSVAHLSRSRDPFSADMSMKMPMRYTFHGGVRIKASDFIDVIPNALYIRQQKAEEKGLGAYTQIKFPGNNELIAGAMYRFKDAAVASVGYHFNDFVMGMSYDFNTSSLNRASLGRGGLELSLSYMIRKRIDEPDEICPRL